MSNYENIQSFSQAMASSSLACSDPVVADEKIHRFHVAGDKPGTKNGWYVFYGHVGIYGSWKTGEKHLWNAKSSLMTDEIRRHIQSQLEKSKSDYKVEKRKEHLVVAKLSQRKWLNAPLAMPNHPYLLAKNVRSHGLRQVGDRLLVPLMDFHGTVWNLQTIHADGSKRFQSGGRVSDLFSPIGTDKIEGFSRLIICEGWATGASLHEVTSVVLLAAMNAGNLVNVAKKAREQFPDVELIIAADNDHKTPGNPGITKALEAAQLTQAIVMTPSFPEGVEGTDYNDAVNLGWRI